MTRAMQSKSTLQVNTLTLHHRRSRGDGFRCEGLFTGSIGALLLSSNFTLAIDSSILG